MIQTHYAKFLKNELIKICLLRGYITLASALEMQQAHLSEKIT